LTAKQPRQSSSATDSIPPHHDKREDNERWRSSEPSSPEVCNRPASIRKIDRLPFETIFKSAVAASPHHVKSLPNAALLAITHASYSWRESALRMLALWVVIAIRVGTRKTDKKCEISREWLRRSQNLPLDLDVFEGGSTPEPLTASYQQFISILAQSMNRCRSLKFNQSLTLNNPV
jgi:hypothetical protein